jgi:hypothetical protein
LHWDIVDLGLLDAVDISFHNDSPFLRSDSVCMRTKLFVMTLLAGLASFGLVSCQSKLPTAPHLAFPENGARVHASVYGSLPVLAWRAGGVPSGSIEHFEVWINGSQVDQIPAGIHGSLPGEVEENYEPFRAFGYSSQAEITYYTPARSMLKAGNNRWSVVAVDQEGQRQPATGEVYFSLEDPPNSQVFVNHLGTPAQGIHRVVVSGQPDGRSFEVVGTDGETAYEGILQPSDGDIGEFSFGEFDGLEPGTYRIRVGSEESLSFPVGWPAELNYEIALRKYRNGLQRKRCGDTELNWTGRPCHLDDARIEDGERKSIVGGWHASSDVRKIMRILQPGLRGLIEMKRVHDPDWDQGNETLLDEIKWGNQYIHRMQNKDGAILQHYYLWCGIDNWSEEINRLTNNIIGDEDDRLLREDTLIIDLVSQIRFIENQAAIYRLYREEDPEYAQHCLEAARRCYQYFIQTWPEVTDFETRHNARPYEERVSDLMPLGYAVRAHLAMLQVDSDSEVLKQVIRHADSLMALQEKEYIHNQNLIRGYFYADASREAIFEGYMAHGGLDGAPGVVVALAELCEALPDHPKQAEWKESLRCYLEDYLLPLSKRNAFGLVPGFLSLEPLHGEMKVGDIYYQILDDNRGVNKQLLRKSILLAKGARILNNPELRDAAYRQLGWVLGANPLQASTAFGLGHGHPRLYKSWLEPASDGIVMQGIGVDKDHNPILRQGHWRNCEMELNLSAWLTRTICELKNP